MLYKFYHFIADRYSKSKCAIKLAIRGPTTLTITKEYDLDKIAGILDTQIRPKDPTVPSNGLPVS